MKAVIELDVPEWQIGQDVSVYFPDTMLKHGKCELLKEQEAVEPISYHYDGTIFKYECRKCRTKVFKGDLFCRHCGRPVLWEGR